MVPRDTFLAPFQGGVDGTRFFMGSDFGERGHQKIDGTRFLRSVGSRMGVRSELMAQAIQPFDFLWIPCCVHSWLWISCWCLVISC